MGNLACQRISSIGAAVFPGFIGMTMSSASTALTGSMPPLSAFPRMTISGLTDSWSQASIRPVRHKPVWISSATINTLYSVQVSGCRNNNLHRVQPHPLRPVSVQTKRLQRVCPASPFQSGQVVIGDHFIPGNKGPKCFGGGILC